MSCRGTAWRISVVCSALALAATATLAAVPGWQADRRLTRDDAESTTSINFARSIAVDQRGRLHVVWIDHRDGNPEVYYKRSLDAGESWGPPIRLTNDSGLAFNPSVAAAGEVVHIAWQDNRADQAGVYYRRSTDGGISWQREGTTRLAGAGSPSVAVAESTVHIVYGRPVGTDESDVFYVRSLDGGESWQAERRISDMPFSSWTPTIAAAEGHVYIAWTDTFDARVMCCQEEEYFAYSDDNGATWSDPVRLTQDPPGAMASSWAPSLAASGQWVWIVWFDQRSGDWEIYTKRSQDHGRTWSEDRRLTISDGAAVRPSIAQRGAELFVTYWDHPAGEPGEIFLLHSADLGESWDPPQRLTHRAGSSTFPSVAAGEHGVDVVWSDERDGNAEVYHKRLPGRAVEVGNGLIAFARGVQGSAQIFTIRPDGTGERQLTFEGHNQHPAWSKDGSRLLFSSQRNGFASLRVMEPDGSNQVPVTSGPVNDFTPDWSYDGTRIAFASVRGSAMQPEIWIINADGSDPSRRTFAPAGTFGSVHPSFAPGDQAIYFGSGMDGSAQVWGMLPDGQGLEQKTNGLGPGFPEANVPEWSRHGVLTFWSGIEGQFGEVWSWDLAAGMGPTKLTETLDPFNSDNPAWSPDGSKILFDSNRGGGVSVWIMNANGSQVRELIPQALGQVAWQPVTAGPGCPETLGNGRFCSACGPCAAGEGDCDNDGECQAGLSCVDNVGAPFGFAPGVDVCVAQGGNPPPPPGSCPLQAGNGRFCTDCGPCGDGEGDCDNDGECQAGLSCVDNIGAPFGFAPGVDVCVAPGGNPPPPPGSCPLQAGNGRFCTDCGPCGDGEGDCDNDGECQAGLSCVDNIGAPFGFAPGVDVCVAQGGACPVSEGAGNFCDVCGPCGNGQGDCDRDSDCQPGLVCVLDIGASFGFAPGVDVCVPGTT